MSFGTEVKMQLKFCIGSGKFYFTRCLSNPQVAAHHIWQPKIEERFERSINEKGKRIGMHRLLQSSQATSKFTLINFQIQLQSYLIDGAASVFYSFGVLSSESQFCCKKAQFTIDIGIPFYSYVYEFNKMSAKFVLKLLQQTVLQSNLIILTRSRPEKVSS